VHSTDRTISTIDCRFSRPAVHRADCSDASYNRDVPIAAAGEHLASGVRVPRDGRTISFELFPPKTDDGERALWATVDELGDLHPDFVSVTYGAGGSTQDRTMRIARHIAEQTAIPAVGHLTCVGTTRDELVSVIEEYGNSGVHTILALRGDPPGGPGAPWVQHPGGLQHADELVALITSVGDFSVGVAAFPEVHPESASLDEDARVLAAKQDAGASFAVTQLFFRSSDYFRLVERAVEHDCSMPILPGIMPVTNVAQIERFAQMSGSEFPVALAARFHEVADDPDAVRELGVDVATELCRELLDGGAPGLHFYTLNRSHSTIDIYHRLELGTRPTDA
jgi:methylenetetrahydrofolate reductase (NADPH)